jgi:transcriptional regulator with XRE-family HTH domain/predicted RNase H-like HicB family nuclease
MLRYPAVVTKEGKNVLARFPTCPGCQTYASPGREIEHEATEALELWLETHLQERKLPPRPPKTFKARGGRVLWVTVEPKLAVKLELRWCREDLGLTQTELARLAHVSQPAIAQIESPDSNPSIDTISRVARAMFAEMDLQIALHPTAAKRIKNYARQLHRLPPGLERQRVVESMRDQLTGRTSAAFYALERTHR